MPFTGGQKPIGRLMILFGRQMGGDMRIKCPYCHTTVKMINGNYAFCEKCQNTFDVAQSSDYSRNMPVQQAFGGFAYEIPQELIRPSPRGTWFRQQDGSTLIGGSLRSGIVLIWVILAFFIWEGAVISANISTWRQGERVLVPFTLGIFVIVGLIPPCMALFALFGKIEVSLSGENSYVFKGIGILGTRQYFNWNAVESVYMTANGLCLNANGSKINIGHGITGWNKDKSYYALKILKYLRWLETGQQSSGSKGQSFTRETIGILGMENPDMHRNHYGPSAKQAVKSAYRDSGDISEDFNVNVNEPKGVWHRQTAEGTVVGGSMMTLLTLFMSLFEMLVFILANAVLIWFFIDMKYTDARLLIGIFEVFLIIVGMNSIIKHTYYGFGKVEVLIGEKSHVFMGIGKLGIKKGFEWNMIRYMNLKEPAEYIYIESDKLIKFGKGMDRDRLKYIFNTLQSLHRAGIQVDSFKD